MAETAHYGLYITDDDQTKFYDWRQQMNGTADSNMTKIDTVLAEKAAKSDVLTSTLLADAWSGETAPFSQTISVPGLTAEQNGMISIPHNCTDEQKQAVIECVFFVSGQADGTLTIEAEKQKPEIDIPVSIILLD